MKSRGAGLGLLMQMLLALSGAQAAEPPITHFQAAEPPITHFQAAEPPATHFQAAELPVTHLTVMGSLAGTAQYRDIEEPFWAHQLAADSGGRVTADVTPFDQTGLKGVEALQMARLGVISFLMLPLSLISSEDPEANAPDLPGLNPTIDAIKTNLEAYRPVLVDLYRTRYRLEPLAMVSYPAQVLYCTDKFERLADLAGRNIRVASGAQASLVGGFGARGIVLPFADMKTGFRNHTIDCAITGTLTGNSVGLAGVTHYLQDLALNWGVQVVVANRATWLSLNPDVRAFLEHELTDLERRVWEQTEQATAEGIACNTGQGACVHGMRGNMVLVKSTAADRALLDRILRTVVLPKWAARCGAECAAEWNRTVGARMGLTAEVPAP